MAIPTYEEIMLPLLTLAQESGSAITIRKSIPIISNNLKLSKDETEQMLNSGKQTVIYNRTFWSAFYLMKAGLLNRVSPGVYQLSDTGKSLLNENPQQINKELLKQYDSFNEFLKTSKTKKDSIEQNDISTTLNSTPDETIDLAYKQINNVLKTEILVRVLDGTPEFFEKLIIELMLAMGYGGSHLEAGQHLGQSNDGGIDGIIKEDRLGLDTIYLQAKRYASHNTVGRPDIQKFAGSLLGNNATKGVFVTTSSFTSGAKDYAHNLTQKIILIDGDELTNLLIENNVGTRTSQTYELKKIDEDFFLDT
jgi:restriction system protein